MSKVMEAETAQIECQNDERDLAEIIQRVLGRIPPMWDLPNFVAVNPFLGWVDRPISCAARSLANDLGITALPTMAHFRLAWQQGQFSREQLGRAAARFELDADQLEQIVSGKTSIPEHSSSPVLSFAKRIDLACHSDWEEQLIRWIARWCAVYASGGGTHWQLPVGGLFEFWRESAAVDRTLEVAGLHGWRKWIQQLPASSHAALAEMLNRLPIPGDQLEGYLLGQIRGVYGWACYCRKTSWANASGEFGPLLDLLAIRVCSDTAIYELAGKKSITIPVRHEYPAIESETHRLALLEATEDALLHRMLSRIAPNGESAQPSPAVQAAFCIDVRSELFRRHLERLSNNIQTIGFAGFFGVALQWRQDDQASARCPVLLSPTWSVESQVKPNSAVSAGMLKHLQTSSPSAFSYVETLGSFYGIGLVRDLLAIKRHPESHECDGEFILSGNDNATDLGRRVELARGILKNMGIANRMAPLVLLCGHEGHSANNPHAAGLDCGACGGHGGGINARFAARLLNDPEVRQELIGYGVTIPSDTWFIAGVHDTSIDEVRLLDLDRLPNSHIEQVRELSVLLAEAGDATRRERAESLGIKASTTKQTRRGLLAKLRRRSQDWSEPRPEWALARNAAFIAARRSRTRAVNLEGRAFLHDYDTTLDPDGSILTLIMTAPMVVASWINLQYFGSTIDNAMLGSGDKALHNRVGTLGVVLGNGGDLRPGLAMQSVDDRNGRNYHEPLRLQVVIEAEREKIDAVLRAQPGVRDLVANGWIRLFALDPKGQQLWRWTTDGWEMFV